MQPGTSILAVYPHDKRPEVIGTFIKSLARARVVIHGLASSPSAISVVLSTPRIKPVHAQQRRARRSEGHAAIGECARRQLH